MTQTWAPIHQRLPGVSTYADDRASFTWDRARAELAGLPGGRGLNIAHEAVDRHVDEGRGM